MNSSQLSLTEMPRRVAQSFREGSASKKIGMIAVGAAVIATSPYWAPAVARSKTMRRLAMLSATHVVPKLF